MRGVVKRLAILILAAAWLAAGGASAKAGCVPWKEAGPLIAKNGLVPATQVYRNVLTRTGGKILHADLCEDNGRFFYKFSVLGPKGDVTKHKVDAKSGQF